jgi:hypothetical protein
MTAGEVSGHTPERWPINSDPDSRRSPPSVPGVGSRSPLGKIRAWGRHLAT